jgi:hypothetical protein
MAIASQRLDRDVDADPVAKTEAVGVLAALWTRTSTPSAVTMNHVRRNHE